MNFFLSCLVILLAIASFGFFIGDACTCAPRNALFRNPECVGEFMAIVNITSVVFKNETSKNEYSFNIIDDRTPALANKESLNKFTIISSIAFDALCGVELDVNAIYLLMGSLNGSPSLHLCDSVWKKLDKMPNQNESKALLDALYDQQC